MNESVSEVERICERIALEVRSDLAQAERSLREAETAATRSGSRKDRALTLRSAAILRWAANDYDAALSKFEESLQLFEQNGERIEAARTRSNAIQTLIYLSRYEEALQWAADARDVFLEAGEHLRLARLDGNVANLLYRQDRFEEAISLYEEVESRFRQYGEPRDVAAVLRNKAVCQLSLSRFHDALETHRASREYSAAHGMPKLIAEADYNIAYLYFLRGDYLAARDLYEDARREAKRAGDTYHAALCDLDQAEMWIELNLISDAAGMARRASRAFQKLGMGYERAKAQVFLALCAGRQGELERALSLLQRARKHFEAEANAVWPALIDLQAALLLEHAGFSAKARGRARRALGFFSPTVLPARAIQCRLLLARTDLEQGRILPARIHVSAAERLLPFAQSPVLAGHTWWVAGGIAEASREAGAAEQFYRRAQEQFESLRDRLHAEELRLSFFQDKSGAYGAHFRLQLREGDLAGAFQTAERAKSRALAAALRPRVRDAAEDGGGLNGLRETLNALYRQLEEQELRPEAAKKQTGLQARIESVEAELRLALENRQAEVRPSPLPTVESVHRSLPAGTALVEYFLAGGQFHAFAFQDGATKAYSLAREADVLRQVRYLQFQLARVRQAIALGQRLSVKATETCQHLNALHEMLVAPIAGIPDARHCVFVPHGILHGLPFHALFDGRRYLGENAAVSIYPSAAVFLRQGEAVRPIPRRGAAVFGVPDAAAPQIRAEAIAVAELMDGASLFLGEEATLRRLEAAGGEAGILHLATHGKFRRDNPWFSSIRLADGPLSLYDLYRLRLPVDLVTLSGCSTGVSAILGGDELVGLVRGLFQAGARASMLSLWDVSDVSTLRFMREFYARLGGGAEAALALQGAQAEVRGEFEHPFYWAPFCLYGGAAPREKKLEKNA